MNIINLLEIANTIRKKLAIEWGIAESEGKYLSCGGVLYNSEKEYLKKQEEYLND